jgi:type IV pilus assembly protein PilE
MIKYNEKKQAGFTLIELMITVSIIGILVSIALPSYTNYLQRADRMQAQRVVLEILREETIYHSNNHSYHRWLGPTGLGYLDVAGASPDTVIESGYSIRVTSCDTSNTIISLHSLTPNCVVITATSDDSTVQCATFSVNTLGEQTPASCWE